jgi:hypothetical protein
MQGGQWEYAVTPSSAGTPMYLDANVPATRFGFSGPVTYILQPAEITSNSSQPISCTGYTTSVNIDRAKVDGQFLLGDTKHFASFSGELAENGQSISNGKYSGGNCSVQPSNIEGTLTGYTVAPLNGTFTGTLTSYRYGADVVTVTFTEDTNDFSLAATGTYVENGVTTAFSATPSQLSSLVVGAAVFSSANATNINGNSDINILGHFNRTATELTVLITGGEDGDSATGTLTKL